MTGIKFFSPLGKMAAAVLCSTSESSVSWLAEYNNFFQVCYENYWSQ